MEARYEQVGIRELRQNLSVYLRRVAEGETLEVTERGRPVARLAPSKSRGVGASRAARGRMKMAEDFDAPSPGEIQRFFEQ